MKKIIFWNVDTQKDFMNPDGALYVEGAESIKPNLKKLTDFAGEHNIMVVNTADMHNPPDEELSDNPDFINTFPPHCMNGSNGMEFIEETHPSCINTSVLSYNDSFNSIDVNAENIIIYKNKFDVFKGNPHTEQFLDLINPDIVIVYGVATNVCVNCAILGLRKRGIEVIVINDAIKELPNLSVIDIYHEWDLKGVGFFTVNKLMDNLKTMIIQGINNDY